MASTTRLIWKVVPDAGLIAPDIYSCQDREKCLRLCSCTSWWDVDEHGPGFYWWRRWKASLTTRGCRCWRPDQIAVLGEGATAPVMSTSWKMSRPSR